MNRVIDEERHVALMSEGESIRQARAILDLLMTLYYDNAASDYIEPGSIEGERYVKGFHVTQALIYEVFDLINDACGQLLKLNDLPKIEEAPATEI